MIKAIKSAIPLETALTEAGVCLRRGRGLCPFHPDRHPSFTVRRNRWRCFAGCGGGDIIDFAKKFYGLSTGAAVRLLAEKAGIRNGPLTMKERAALQTAKRERTEKKELIQALDRWVAAWRENLAFILRETRGLMRGLSYNEALALGAEFFDEGEYLAHVYEILRKTNRRAHLRLYKTEMGL